MSKPEVWTPRDWLDKVCSAEDIGKPKVPETVPEVLPAELDPATDAEIIQGGRDLLAVAFRLAAKHPGGIEGYLRANTDIHKRLILLGARIPVKPPEPKTTVTLNLAWVRPGRLSYKDELQPIIDPDSKD